MQCAQDSGYVLYGLGIYGESAPPGDVFHAWHAIRGRDYSEALAWARRCDIDYVVSTQCDYSLQLQAYIAENLRIPGPGWQQAQLSANKWLQRRACADLNDVKQPTYTLCYGLADAQDAAAELGFQVVIKPVDNRGSIGVTVIDRPEELEGAVWLAIANSLSGSFIVEQRIKGTLFLVDGTGAESLIVGEKTMNTAYTYLNEDILFARPTATGLYRRLASAHETTCELLGYRKGLTSGEYMVDEHDDIWLIEVTNRAGGVWIGSEITAALTGKDSSAQLLQDYAAGAKAQRRSVCDWVYLRYVSLPPGRLQCLTGDERWPEHPQYLAHYLWQPVPAVISPVTDALKRSGVLLTKGQEPQQAKQTATELLNSLEFTYG